MRAPPRPLTMPLGELITTVYDQYGGRHAEALIWFAIHGYRIVSPVPRSPHAALHESTRSLIRS